MKYWESGGNAPHILNLGRSTPGKENPVPIG